jgi:hypothetical protein
MAHPYAVFLEDGCRLGLVDKPEQVAKLLDADPRAGVLMCRRGYVVLADLDAWLCLPRTFKLRDYMSQSTVVRCRSANGTLYYDLRRSGARQKPPGHSRRPVNRKRRPTGRAARPVGSPDKQ